MRPQAAEKSLLWDLDRKSPSSACCCLRLLFYLVILAQFNLLKVVCTTFLCTLSKIYGIGLRALKGRDRIEMSSKQGFTSKKQSHLGYSGSRKRKGGQIKHSEEQLRRKTDEIEAALEAQRAKASSTSGGTVGWESGAKTKAKAKSKAKIAGMIYDKKTDRYYLKKKGKDLCIQEETQPAAPASPSTAHFLRSRELRSSGMKGRYNTVVGGILGRSTAQQLKSTTLKSTPNESSRGCAEALLMSCR